VQCYDGGGCAYPQLRGAGRAISCPIFAVTGRPGFSSAGQAAIGSRQAALGRDFLAISWKRRVRVASGPVFSPDKDWGRAPGRLRRVAAFCGRNAPPDWSRWGGYNIQKHRRGGGPHKKKRLRPRPEVPPLVTNGTSTPNGRRTGAGLAANRGVLGLWHGALGKIGSPNYRFLPIATYGKTAASFDNPRFSSRLVIQSYSSRYGRPRRVTRPRYNRGSARRQPPIITRVPTKRSARAKADAVSPPGQGRLALPAILRGLISEQHFIPRRRPLFCRREARRAVVRQAKSGEL